jgi:small conductance mechanosensitive channel
LPRGLRIIFGTLAVLDLHDGEDVLGEEAMNPDKISKLTESLAPLLISWGAKIVGVLILLWIGLRIAARLGRTVTERLEQRELDVSLARFIGQLVRWAIAAGVVLACLSVFGVETTSFAALIGAAGLAIGLAFQGTLSNFSAGVMLLVFRPFKVGDWVKVGGQSGGIVEVGLFNTLLDTGDKRRIILSNSSVMGATIENVTFHEERRCDIDVGVGYEADIDETREQLEKAIELIEAKLEDGEHVVFLGGLGDSAVNWTLRVWCKTEDYWTVWQQGVRAIKVTLDAANINIPFPQMDVHLNPQSEEGKKAA